MKWRAKLKKYLKNGLRVYVYNHTVRVTPWLIILCLSLVIKTSSLIRPLCVGQEGGFISGTSLYECL